jgi:hypothetical protein
MKKYTYLIFAMLSLGAHAQDDYKLSPLEFSGYIKDVQTVFVPYGMEENWLSDNSIHNRLSLKYYPTDWLTLNIQARNRLIYGDFVKYFPDYASNAQTKNYWMDLDYVWLNDSSVVGLSELDRMYAQFNKGDWEVTIGRQRINWGMNLVWNPNDIFNTFSYFDFEYEERPGTDAVRMKYYTSITGSAELVYKAGDELDEMACAGLYRFNKWSYDFQLLGGFMGKDYVIGTGYSGNIKGAAFRGELTYFKPRHIHDNTIDEEGVVVSSISSDYTFGNTLYLHGGLLFNSSGKSGKPGQIQLLGENELSPKMLSRGKWNLFSQASINVTPLITASLSTIMNPDDMSVFISPSVTFSISDNFSFSAFGQFFSGSINSEYGQIGQIGYFRFKYSF